MEKLIIAEAEELQTMITDAVSRALSLVKVPEKDLTRKEFMAKHKICRSTLRNWERDGIITSKKIGGRYYYSSDVTPKTIESNAK